MNKKFTNNLIKFLPAAANKIIKEIYFFAYKNKVKKIINGKGNRISYSRSILNNVIFDIHGSDNLINISENCFLNNVTFYIRGNNHKISIKKNCRFNISGEIYFEDNNGSLSIGDSSTFEIIHIAITEANSSVSIGRDCMFSYGIEMRTGDSHSIINVTSKKRINHAASVIVGDHVWVGAHSLILKGVVILNNSVVASGSIVTKKYSISGIIIGGNPAKIIKQGINWLRNRI